MNSSNSPSTLVTAGSVTALFSQLKKCDAAALGEVWRRFFPRMAGLARRTLSQIAKSGTAPEDVAQCAFISFWKALDEGREFEFADRDHLWGLLALLTARKARHFSRRESAQKRGGGKTRNESELATLGDEKSASRLDLLLAEISPPEFDLGCEELLLCLEEPDRAVAILRLNGYSTDEIASLVDRSRRSVQRTLETVRARWKAFAESG
jgi:RNA polymerase sigma factor (sigma-70 family)